MLKLQLKLAWRGLVRHRSFSVISILGLSAAVAFCLLLMLQTGYELSYDGFYGKNSPLYRLEMTDFQNFSAESGKTLNSTGQLYFPFFMGEQLKQSFPEIENIDRLQFPLVPIFVRAAGSVYKETRFVFTDEHFFSILPFGLLSGSAAGALRGANDVVLSESSALRYFGTTDVLGKVLEIRMDSARLFRITGVAHDAPENSGIQFDMVLPNIASDQYKYWQGPSLDKLSHMIIIQLKPEVDAEAFGQKLNAWQRDHFAAPYAKQFGKDVPDFNFRNLKWWLSRLPDCHYEASKPWGHYTNWKSLSLLYGIALVILAIAALNYILLAVATGASRMQELGMRKVMGAKRWNLALQYWTETVLVVLFATLMGLVLAWILLPAFNTVMGGHLRAGWPLLGLALALLPGFVLGLATVASLYPAIILSGADPLPALKRLGTFRINPSFGKALVVFQFACCTVLLCSALVINRQMRYMSELDLGFDQDNVLLVNNEAFDLPFVRAMDNRFREEVRHNPAFTGYSVLTGDLSGDGGFQNAVMLGGKMRLVMEMDVGFDYFNLLRIPVVAGRVFSRDFGEDGSISKPVCVVNETLFKMLGKDAQVGVYNRALNAIIIGVVKDYHIDRLESKILPVEHLLARGNLSYFIFRVRGGQLQPVLTALRRAWSDVSTTYPFEFSFLDQRIAAMYASDRNQQRIMEAACLLAVVIGCMGLFGLSAVTVVNYRKNVGIRKVLGAGNMEITFYLSRNFMTMVLLSLAVGIPAGWWLMGQWLNRFAYRVSLEPLLFVAAALAVVAIASLSIAWHVVRAARVEAVKNLRVE
jgi:putative ABC transport system permease protein